MLENRNIVTHLGEDLVEELDVESVLLLGDSFARAVRQNGMSINRRIITSFADRTHSPALAWKVILLASMSSLGSP
jgi:hypothetical protein